MTSMLLSVAAFRLSVFQPILAGCGIGCIQFPIIDDDVWLPGVGTLKTIKDESSRENMPKYNDVILKVKDYIFETRSKINILFDELERRKGIANPSTTKRVQETSPDGTASVIKTVDLSPVKKQTRL